MGPSLCISMGVRGALLIDGGVCSPLVHREHILNINTLSLSLSIYIYI
jgi:hypothetical protein